MRSYTICTTSVDIYPVAEPPNRKMRTTKTSGNCANATRKFFLNLRKKANEIYRKSHFARIFLKRLGQSQHHIKSRLRFTTGLFITPHASMKHLPTYTKRATPQTKTKTIKINEGAGVFDGKRHRFKRTPEGKKEIQKKRVHNEIIEEHERA